MGFDWGGVAASIGGSLVSGLFGQSSASQQFERQKELMELQHKYNVEDYQHRYQWASDDMQKAGLNRILAATNGIGGSINGVSSGVPAMAPTPDFAGAFNSAYQTGTYKEIAKLQNDIAKGQLELQRNDVNSAIDKRRQDMTIEKGRFELEKWTAKENIRLKEVMQEATIKNMVERLQADVEHMARMDANGAVTAAAAMAQANASGLMAQVQAKLGISREELNDAQEAYLAIMSENAEESLEWQKWLNDHPYTRGAVGFIGSLFDTVGLVRKTKGLADSFGGLGD